MVVLVLLLVLVVAAVVLTGFEPRESWCKSCSSQPACQWLEGWRAQVKEKSLKVGAEKKWCKMLLLAPNNNVAK